MHLFCDHPGWNPSGARAVRTPHGPLVLVADSVDTGDPGILYDGVALDRYSPADLGETVPAHLRTALADQGPVSRLRTPDLWEAVATAIIRQVIRADQARLMYRRFTTTLGEAIGNGRAHVFPTPETVLTVTDAQFHHLGMAFKGRPLRAAAEAYAQVGTKWNDLPAADLVEELQTVPRIGPWTAGAAVADHTGDFSHYPYGDMAVRKYARQAAPSLDLPDSEADFATRWRGYAGSPGELSALTVLTLALGGHRGRTPPD